MRKKGNKKFMKAAFSSVITTSLIMGCFVTNSFSGLLGEGPLIDVRYNWLGDASDPYHPILNPFGLSDNISDNVLCVPWYDAIYPCGNLTNGPYFYNNITSGSGNWMVPSDIYKIDVLVIGGGGGAGKGAIQPSRNPGAGGAGGLIWLENVTKIGDVDIIPENVIPYSIGEGGIGAAATTSQGGSGGDTTFGNLTAKGGGGGGSIENLNGVNGGSGGGGGRYGNNYGVGGTETQTGQTGWSGEYGYGNNGASAVIGGSGGGGGGAGEAGSGETGGAGINMSAYFGTDYGVNGVFAKGGDGGSDGSVGVANSGNGANANPDTSDANGANGGSGIILIRMYDSAPPIISNVVASPSSQVFGGFVNISCNVIDNVEVGVVKVIITYPDNSSENLSMDGVGIYYKNQSYLQVGSYSYFIWAEDICGNSNTSPTYQFYIISISLNLIPIHQNWNLISLPFNESVNKTDIVVSYGGTNYSWNDAVTNNIIVGFIYSWNRTIQSYETIDILDPGYGYWIWAYHNCDLLVSSNVSEEDYITALKQKWNIVGLPYNISVAKENLIIYYNNVNYTWQQAVDANIILGFIYGWDRNTQNYILSDDLDPGYGYWMYAYYDCILKK